MPSRGNELHEYLKKKSSNKVVKIYGDKIDFIKYEQPQDYNTNKEQNYFKITITLGSEWHDSREFRELAQMNFPDILVQVNLTDEEKKFLRSKRKDMIPEKKVLILECETTASSLVSSKATPRYHLYKLIKLKHKDDIVLILATFKDINVKTDLFDRVWRFKRP